MKKEISLKVFLIVMVFLVVLEIALLFAFRPKNSDYCQEAVCNEDESICYAYDLDDEGNTVIVWRGSCQAGN